MELLISRIAAVRDIPMNCVEETHQVREYRNAAVHDTGGVDSMTFHECKSRLAKFLSYLPVRW